MVKIHFPVPLFFAWLLTFGNPLKAQVWSDVGGGTGMGTVFCVYADKVDDLLYVGGIYDTLGPDSLQSRGFAAWDGTKWIDLTQGINGYGNDFTRAIGRYNGEIYHSVELGGIFYGEQREDHRIAKFSCTNPDCHGNTAYAFQEYQGELYVGGTFLSFKETPNDLLYGIVKWNGVSWSKVGGGFRSIVPVEETGVNALFVYKGKLYAGGTFDSAGTIGCNNIAVWDGIVWNKVGTGLRGAPDGKPAVDALISYKGALIAGGTFDSAGSISARNIAKWDGTSWTSLDVNFNETVMALCVYKKNLYAGGYFSFNGEASNHVAKWDGISWSALGGGITSAIKIVRSLTVWDKKLVVGGAFTELEDSIVVANIATWKISSNEPIPLKESDFVTSTDIISGPSVIHLKGPEWIRQIDVIDQLGRLFPVQVFSNGNFNSSIELEVKNWAPGIYILRIHTNAGIVNKKIVVM
jgi:hypothetical protein